MSDTAAKLDALRSHTHAKEDVTEEFLEARLGPARAFALLSAPAGRAARDAWILCPSIGQEHGNLRRLEASIARGLAREGRVALRIRPDLDPDGALPAMDLDARIAEAVDAASVLRERGLSVRGVFGAVSGAMVACLVCEDLGVDSLAVVEPVRRGRQYGRESLRRQAVTDLMSVSSPDGLSPLQQLEADGVTWIRGVRLTQSSYERLAAADAVEALRSFRGRALLLGISPTGAAPQALTALEAHLVQLGASVTAEVIEDPLPVPLGEYYFENVGPVRQDTRIDLDRLLTVRTAEWVAEESA